MSNLHPPLNSIKPNSQTLFSRTIIRPMQSFTSLYESYQHGSDSESIGDQSEISPMPIFEILENKRNEEDINYLNSFDWSDPILYQNDLKITSGHVEINHNSRIPTNEENIFYNSSFSIDAREKWGNEEQEEFISELGAIWCFSMGFEEVEEEIEKEADLKLWNALRARRDSHLIELEEMESLDGFY